MSTRLFVLLMLVLAEATAVPAAPKRTVVVRLATYNLLDFFDHEDDPALSGRYDDLPMAIAEPRARQLAKIIRAIDADVLALQEVESRDALVWFRDTYLADMGYDHVASQDVGYFRGIECAVLSRIEIIGEEVWPRLSLDGLRRDGTGWAEVPEGKDLVFRRSPLRVDLRAPDGYELTLFVVHHKAGADFDYQREAEALKVLELAGAVAQADQDRNVAVIGDFNAAPWDKSLRAYLNDGFVDTLAYRATRGAEGRMYKTHRSGRVLDYILLNPGAYREFVVGSAQVYGRAAGAGDASAVASDHYPVIIDLITDDRR